MINLQLCQCQSQQSPALPVHSPVHNGTKSLSPRPQAQPVSPSPLPQEHPIPACISLQTQRDTEGAHSPSPSQLPWAAWLWRYSQPLSPQPSSGIRTPIRREFRLLQPQLQPREWPGCECS